MHHGSAGKVQGSHLSHPAARPDPVGQGIIDQGGPEQGQHDERAELDPLRHGRCQDGQSYSCEDQLKGHVDQMRYVAGQGGLAQSHTA